ncbi:hypothetical protein [Winogradskyella sediminis]|uniref:Uncharacterized protein n=1 Tax=Winogradskyella sediminis TaxID=1382466 RepID=A0A1H1VI81_9FLAO|nr:hypothetical protein [Winogradskyella sediminis]SDS84558.1 hypothetical protein SAMN04489797_2565 [Winogradskyella sediminis]
MKRFLIKIGGLFICSVIMLIVLDLVYTSIYTNSGNSRSKVAWLFGLSDEESVDYAVFGSSRVHFNLDPMLIKERTGFNGFNLAFPNSKGFEIKLMVKLFLEKYNVDKIFIQVDDQYEVVNNDPTAIVPFLPYINNVDVYEAFSGTVDGYYLLRYIPFYRYLKYDSKLGFRELMMSLYTKDKSADNSLGYGGSSNKVMKERNITYKFKLDDIPNRHLEEVIKLCKEKNVKLYFYTAPIYKADGNLNVLNKYLPNYHDFSDNFEEAKLFRDPYHLNSAGTTLFTKQFTDYYFKP